MQTEQDNDAFAIPPDAFRTDYRAQQMVCAVDELIKCPQEEFTPMVLLEMQLACSVLLAKINEMEPKQ